jgi:hypothetical protein
MFNGDFSEISNAGKVSLISELFRLTEYVLRGVCVCVCVCT